LEKGKQDLEAKKALQISAEERRQADQEEKKEELRGHIEEVNKEIAKDGGLETLRNELAECQQENDEVNKDLKGKKAELDRLTKLLIGDEELRKMEEKVRFEMEELIEMEREMKGRIAWVQNAENEVETEEDKVKQTRNEVVAEEEMLDLRKLGARKVLAIHERQCICAERRYFDLLSRIELLEDL
jgi:DNA repair ATPase RecN